MSNRQRVIGLRLGINHEAEALVSIWGAEAYAVALKRADEASSEDMNADWDQVAAVIARKTGRSGSLLASVFH